MSTFDDFEAKWNNKPCEMEDASAPDQCMDLAFAWCDAMGVDRAAIRHQFAYQVWTEPNDETVKFFELVPNTPNGFPPEGALIIFNQNVGAAGHISIGTKRSDKDNLISFDQNWAGAAYCKEVTHVYTNVFGWLIKRVPPSTDPLLLAQSDAFIAVATKLNTAANKDIVLAEIDKLVTIEDLAPAKDKQLSDAASQLTFLEGRVGTLQTDHDTLATENAAQAQTILDHDKQIGILSDSIKTLKTQLQQTSAYPTMTGWQLIANGISKLLGRT